MIGIDSLCRSRAQEARGFFAEAAAAAATVTSEVIELEVTEQILHSYPSIIYSPNHGLPLFLGIEHR